MSAEQFDERPIRVSFASGREELQSLLDVPTKQDRAYLLTEIPEAALGSVKDELASHGEVEALASLLRSVRASPAECSDVDAQEGEVLTAFELRIGELLLRGYTNRQVATELSLAQNTVRNYVSRMIQKVGARNRTELAVQLAQRKSHAHQRRTG